MPGEKFIFNQSGNWKLLNKFEVEKFVVDNHLKWRFTNHRSRQIIYNLLFKHN